MQPRQPEGAQEEAKRLPKCCLGAAYFSMGRYAAQKPPVCAGFAKRLKPTDDAAQLPTDSVPGGDFKYVCLGYSAWDEEALKRAAARRSSQADAVQLPYCEGLEVVSAAAVNQRPELMGAGGPDMAAGGGGPDVPPPPGPQQGGDVRQRPGRSFVPGAGRLPDVGDGLDWERLKGRFLRISRRMVDKMGQNVSYMAATTRRSWQQIVRELGGDDKER
ncbi:hypothetical protein CHLNCDRAFT_141886 [Chlorella variabilis]|uniref:DUF8204 domain-containing protein n=1 Tax=Chlorella variabilis TaxID=554065 RepID=E1Z795_CHLVA|nr:hypothetical protein CHLNCDRAFT_141886 [Chlorella variabilis]EFN58135.1 hypothetical protein CHLNCDRAFT_141886 [Chlorella variabilis]|eukprot:XP_005850237.1 hypothetical protein CHLNCDRAFT_141886 [Chlorella variabilis]